MYGFKNSKTTWKGTNFMICRPPIHFTKMVIPGSPVAPSVLKPTHRMLTTRLTKIGVSVWELFQAVQTYINIYIHVQLYIQRGNRRVKPETLLRSVRNNVSKNIGNFTNELKSIMHYLVYIYIYIYTRKSES